MIKLTKADEPEVLKNNGEAWTNELLGKIARGEKLTPSEASRYRHPEIKAAVIAETHGKCAYCESKLRHIHHGDIEHIFPKSLDEKMRFQWSNLTLACEICNQNKSNKDPNFEYIIDPYKIDPEEHILFVGAFTYSKSIPQGLNTKTILDLNRVELVERRQEKLDQIMQSFEIVLHGNLPDITKKIIFENIKENDGAGSSPYAAMVRSLIQQMEAYLPNGLQKLQA